MKMKWKYPFTIDNSVPHLVTMLNSCSSDYRLSLRLPRNDWRARDRLQKREPLPRLFLVFLATDIFWKTRFTSSTSTYSFFIFIVVFLFPSFNDQLPLQCRSIALHVWRLTRCAWQRRRREGDLEKMKCSSIKLVHRIVSRSSFLLFCIAVASRTIIIIISLSPGCRLYRLSYMSLLKKVH